VILLLCLHFRASELKMDKCLTSILTMEFEGVSILKLLIKIHLNLLFWFIVRKTNVMSIHQSYFIILLIENKYNLFFIRNMSKQLKWRLIYYNLDLKQQYLNKIVFMNWGAMVYTIIIIIIKYFWQLWMNLFNILFFFYCTCILLF